MSSRIPPSTKLATQATELAFAVPQVIAHRVARMAMAGAFPDARDRREFNRMGSEKVAAFYESWNAMFMQAARAQYEFGASLMRSMWFPLTATETLNDMTNAYLESMTHGMAGKGFAPVHRRAVANARRLGGAAR